MATLVTSSSSASRPSPLGLGGCLCIASTARSLTYRLIYSRTRAYQTRPAVELVSSKEGLSLSRLLRPPCHCDVPGGLLWYVVTGTRFPEVRPHRPPVLLKRPWSLRGSRGYAPMGAHGWVCSLLYAVHQMLSLVPCTGTVSGAAGHNRWGVVERRLPAKTQGRTADCTLTSFHHVLLQGGSFKVSLRNVQQDCSGFGGHESAPCGALSP